jgi:membrane-associated phospholipid phosphatase
VVASSSAVVWGRGQEGWSGTVNQFARLTPWLHAPARLYAEYGVALSTAALWAPAGALIAIGVNQFLVAAFAEPRPYTAMPGALVLVSRSTDYSFPSDHAVMAGAVTVGGLLANRKLGLVTAAALAVLMAATRIYVGAKLPLDVAARLAVGAIVALASYGATRPLFSRSVLLLTRTRVRPFVTAQPAGAIG